MVKVNSLIIFIACSPLIGEALTKNLMETARQLTLIALIGEFYLFQWLIALCGCFNDGSCLFGQSNVEILFCILNQTSIPFSSSPFSLRFWVPPPSHPD